MNEMPIDLSRRRAICTYKIVKHVISNISDEEIEEAKNKRQELRTICRKLPVLIQQNSLVTTLMYLSKAKEDENEEKKRSVNKYLFDEIIEWLKEYTGNDEISNKDFFVQNICCCNISQYRALTTEAILFANWLKNNVESLIE